MHGDTQVAFDFFVKLKAVCMAVSGFSIRMFPSLVLLGAFHKGRPPHPGNNTRQTEGWKGKLFFYKYCIKLKQFPVLLKQSNHFRMLAVLRNRCHLPAAILVCRDSSKPSHLPLAPLSEIDLISWHIFVFRYLARTTRRQSELSKHWLNQDIKESKWKGRILQLEPLKH